MRRVLFLAGVPLLALALGGCRNDMHHQAKIKPFRESRFFSDGASARALPEGTVARVPRRRPKKTCFRGTA